MMECTQFVNDLLFGYILEEIISYVKHLHVYDSKIIILGTI